MPIPENHTVEVILDPTKKQVAIISNAPSSYNPGYDESYTSKSQIAKMPLIEEFFDCPKHRQMT
eukprot:6402400-Ditylum_brightwellii.AAC.1